MAVGAALKNVRFVCNLSSVTCRQPSSISTWKGTMLS